MMPQNNIVAKSQPIFEINNKISGAPLSSNLKTWVTDAVWQSAWKFVRGGGIKKDWAAAAEPRLYDGLA